MVHKMLTQAVESWTNITVLKTFFVPCRILKNLNLYRDCLGDVNVDHSLYILLVPGQKFPKYAVHLLILIVLQDQLVELFEFHSKYVL